MPKQKNGSLGNLGSWSDEAMTRLQNLGKEAGLADEQLMKFVFARIQNFDEYVSKSKQINKLQEKIKLEERDLADSRSKLSAEDYLDWQKKITEDKKNLSSLKREAQSLRSDAQQVASVIKDLNKEQINAISQDVKDENEKRKFEESLNDVSRKRRQKALKAFDEQKKAEKNLAQKQKEINDYKQTLHKKENELTQDEVEQLRKLEQSLLEAEDAVEGAKKNVNNINKKGGFFKQLFSKEFAKENAEKALNNMFQGAVNALSSDVDLFTKNRASMMARLQGNTTNYSSLFSNVTSRIAISPYVSQRDVLQNIQSLVGQGVAFNVEQRGFLMTLADKIAPTFEANSEALLRLVRLQGEDTTAQRLGLEAALTRSLNATFKDTAYLNNLFDTIRDAIFDAESQLDKESATEFEYNTQKWLSSIYSVGGSSTFITNLAQGINMLGTGDVTGLAGNESLQTLLAMALSRSGSGLTYSDVLLGGLNASSVNEVLYQVIEYLQEIEKNSRDNMVIRSQYARLFGMSVADFAALTNLSNDMMSGLRGQNINYQGFNNELTNQLAELAKVGNRLTLGEMVQNALDNVVTTMASGIAQSPGMLAAWQLNSLVENATGGINLPAINVLGSGINLNATLNQLIKLGLGGFGLISQIANVVGAITSGNGGLDLSKWTTEQNMRGGGFVATTAGVSTGLSESVRYQGSSSYGDMEQETLQTATTRAQDVGEITSAGVDTTKKTSDDIWQAMFSEDSPYAVRVKLVEVDPSILSVPVRITDQGLGSSDTEPLYTRGLFNSDTP